MIRAVLAEAIANALTIENKGVGIDRPDLLPFANVLVGASQYQGENGQAVNQEYELLSAFDIVITTSTPQSDVAPYDEIELVIDAIKMSVRGMDFPPILRVVDKWVERISEVNFSDDTENKAMQATIAIIIKHREAVLA